MGVNFVTFSVHASHRGRHQMCWSNKSPSHVSLLLESCVTRRKNPLIINPQDFQSACQKVKILINSCLLRCPLEWLRFKSIRTIPLTYSCHFQEDASKIFEILNLFDGKSIYLWHWHSLITEKCFLKICPKKIFQNICQRICPKNLQKKKYVKTLS